MSPLVKFLLDRVLFVQLWLRPLKTPTVGDFVCRFPVSSSSCFVAESGLHLGEFWSLFLSFVPSSVDGSIINLMDGIF